MSDIVIGHLVIYASPMTESMVPVRLVAAPEPKKNEAKAFEVLEACLDYSAISGKCLHCMRGRSLSYYGGPRTGHDDDCPLFGVVDHREAK